MDSFEKNSVKLMKAGYIFAMANILDGCIAGYPACLMPMWVRETDKENTEKVHAILGSEPKIGENLEVELDRTKMQSLIFAPLMNEL
tara:strand:- start:1238 stop:1498 length:261 start_codon:yes stop_codon:yes gene_type:complete